MKKCCINCHHFHSYLGEEESFYHIHDYCDAWDRTNSCPMYSLINSFLDDYCINFDHICDDNETGESHCYRFEPVDKEDKTFDDSWLKENFEHNKELALKLIDKIILDGKYYNKFSDKEDELAADDLKYFREVRKQIISTTWEEDDGKVCGK